jgi:alpha/beta superfamily hydrolase
MTLETGQLSEAGATVRSQVRTIGDMRGPAGRLEAVLNTGAEEAPYAALVCHPYPPAGGTVHNKVVYHAMKAFSGLGLPVVRFNFRGVGLSEGTFGNGHGERDDVRAALDWMAAKLKRPILFAGFSFGSYVGLRACCEDDRVKGRIGLGLPVRAAGRDYTYGFLKTCAGPRLFVSGDHDQFSPREVLEPIFAGLPEPKRLVWIAGADHFFQGIPGSPEPKLHLMQEAIRDWTHESFLTE